VRSEVVLIQITTPPKQAAIADTSDKLQWQLLELVGRICGTYGALTSEGSALPGGPVKYFTSRPDEEELAALYAVTDVCLDTSLRDGGLCCGSAEVSGSLWRCKSTPRKSQVAASRRFSFVGNQGLPTPQLLLNFTPRLASPLQR